MKQTFFDFNKRSSFPDPALASPLHDFCLGYGGDLSVKRLLAAYKKGIFPWYSFKGEPYWFSPDPRCVLFPDELHVSKSMQQLIRAERFTVTIDKAFKKVIKNCAAVKRKHDSSTWITKDFIDAYEKLHQAGYAHSVEVWDGNTLAGGLYGVSLGRCFFGESMFSHVSNASKYGFIFLVQKLKEKKFAFIDCQIYNDHLGTLGAKNILRSEFLSLLKPALRYKTLHGSWANLFAS